MGLNMGRRFVTLFPYTYNVNLMKDVGCIPYVLYKKYGYDSTIVSFKNDDYEYLHKYVSGLKIEFLPNGNERIESVKYVLKNAKKIDVLNMYHMSIGKSLLCFNLYKMLNKNGVGYLKLDLDFKTLDIIENYNGLKKFIIRLMANKVDIISAESTLIAKKMEDILNRTVEYIPDGVLEYKNESSEIDLNKKKRNCFLTVGRLGTEQKATEQLVEAFIKIRDNTKWNLWLVGSCEDKFTNYLDRLFERYPDLKERINVTGEILDKDKLTEIYRSSNILVLPSKYESFALVNVEGMLEGCRLLLSDRVAPANDFKKMGGFCEVVEFGDVKQLADRMISMSESAYDANQIAKIAADNFLWEKICGKIDKLISKHE